MALSLRDVFCPEGAVGFGPGFQPWETSNKAVRPARARDHVDQMRSECYRKGIGCLLGRDTISFFASVSYTSGLTPFQGASPGWAVQKVETLGRTVGSLAPWLLGSFDSGVDVNHRPSSLSIRRFPNPWPWAAFSFSTGQRTCAWCRYSAKALSKCRRASAISTLPSTTHRSTLSTPAAKR